ncbi:hypothetical protein HOF92_02050, partial [bacterium]|nr:hypothetical protein [bacterium]
SGGANQTQQRTYMVETRTVNSGSSTSIETWVVQLEFDPATSRYQKSDIIRWEGGSQITLGSQEIPADGILRSGTSPLNVAMAPKRIIIYDFEGHPPYSRSVQTSKREFSGETPPDSKDYIYVSNLPPSHFNVSSSFWGTGGVVWWAKPSGPDLQVYFEQANHVSGKVLLDGSASPVTAKNATPLLALGADGENFVYLMHLGSGSDGSGGMEGPAEMARLVTPATPQRIQQVCADGRVLGDCPSFPLQTDVPGGIAELSLTLKIHVGAMVEKIAPLPGSVPVKVGVIPLEATGATCTGSFIFRDTNSPLDGKADGAGTFVGLWNCTPVSQVAQSIADQYNFEMAVINVANPPATAGRFQLDLVAQQPGNILKGGVSTFVEDSSYSFYMENPPVFNGLQAQLGLASDPELNSFGDVSMLSNFESAGIELTRQNLRTLGVEDYFFDDDSRQGTLLPSFIKKPGQLLGTLLNPDVGPDTSSTPSRSNLRYRWRVEAKTPPHAFKNYDQPNCEPLLNSADGSTLPNKEVLVQAGFVDLNYKEVPFGTVGVLKDTCWKDLEDANPAGIATEGLDPEALSFTFEDPGIYSVVLYFGGTRFNADDKTFLDLASSISAEVAVTWYAMEIVVGARPTQTSDEIREVVIANNFLSQDQETRAGIYPDGSDTISEHTNQIDAQIDDGDLVGVEGRFPVLPVGNISNNSAPLVVTYQDQRTPIVAEAEIHFFRLADLNYDAQSLGIVGKPDSRQTKFKGVGAWDYSYPGGGVLAAGNLNFSPREKVSTHPSNWSTSASQTGARISTSDKDHPSAEERRGYDASGDYETGVGYQANGSLIAATGADAQFQAAHQGTLGSDDGFPSKINGVEVGQNLIENPEALYSWWEIKYAWFMRYSKPDGTVGKKIIKTGNLAEIFLMNLMILKGSSGFEQLVKNLAPNNLNSEGKPSPPPDSPLMWYMGNTAAERRRDRTLRVRIPLFNPGAVLNSSDVLSELDRPVRSFSSSDGFGSLYSRIHPLSFPVPTEPTILEIGFQLFYPVMSWEGRDESPAGSGNYSYYDAVYWGPSSLADGRHNPLDFTKTNLSFGPDSISIWPILSTQRILETGPGSNPPDPEASTFGLELSSTQNIGGTRRVPGGFKASGGNEVSYTAPGGRIDHFVDVAVLDMKAPRMRTVEGQTLTATTGGRADGDVVLEVSDNNPFGLWDSYEKVGNDGSGITQDRRLRVPALVQFSYEIGYDPKNHYGVGLKSANLGSKGERAYGFHLSYTSLQTNQDQLTNRGSGLPIYDLSLLGLSTPAVETSPGYSYNPQNLISDDFIYPWKEPSNKFPTDGVFIERRNSPFSLSTDSPGNEQSWERVNDQINSTKFYPPTKGISSDPAIQNFLGTRDQNLRTEDPTIKHPGLNSWMISLVPDVANQAPFSLTPDHPDGKTRVEYLPSSQGSGAQDDYVPWKPGCLLTTSPLTANPDDCSITTRWRVRGQFLLAPFFVNGDQPNPGESSLVYNLYAKARDVRITKDFPDFSDPSIDWNSTVSSWNQGNFGSWPKFQFASNWYRRQGAENYGEDGMMGADGRAASQPLENKIGRYYNNELQRRATRVGKLVVQDNDPPNFRVTLMEFKYNKKVEYTLLGAQGFEPDPSQNPDNDSNRVVIFRTEDKRAENNPIFNSSSIYEERDETLLRANPADKVSHFLINQISPSTQERDLAYHIPEDVRFIVKVEATDNQDLDEIDIKVSSAPDGKVLFTSSNPKVRHISDDQSEHRFKAKSSTKGRIYQQSKILTVYHLYPNANFYDVIRVEVKDKAGNGRVLDIPVSIIEQGVHFRKIGDRVKLK